MSLSQKRTDIDRAIREMKTLARKASPQAGAAVEKFRRTLDEYLEELEKKIKDLANTDGGLY